MNYFILIFLWILQRNKGNFRDWRTILNPWNKFWCANEIIRIQITKPSHRRRWNSEPALVPESKMAEGDATLSASTSSNREGGSSLCEECKSKPSKYKCPACSLRSCSLNCVNAHKRHSGCTGKRKHIQLVSLSQFNDSILLSGTWTPSLDSSHWFWMFQLLLILR